MTTKHTNDEEQIHEVPVSEQEIEDTHAVNNDNEEQEVENEEASVENQLEEANEEIAKLKDQLLRQVAEFDNYRKRTLKEKADLILNGGEKIITALLPVLDDFERALANMDKSEDVPTLKEGVDLIYKKFADSLQKSGLKPIETKDTDFNTDFHEAIAMVPVQDDSQKGKIIDCVQTGYMLNDKVIRHAKVAVGQ